MREILFRGKTLTGRWVEGSYYKQEEFYGSKEDADVIITSKESLTYDQALDYEIVLSKTVGQYTGLTDKNGKKIFEGDMIKSFDDVIDKMVVEFCHGQFLLCLYGERDYMAEYGLEESGNYGCFEAEPLSSYGDDIEVIGNIHDNPELLKGGEG